MEVKPNAESVDPLKKHHKKTPSEEWRRLAMKNAHSQAWRMSPPHEVSSTPKVSPVDLVTTEDQDIIKPLLYHEFP